MTRLFPILLFAGILCGTSKVFAEEKAVTVPLLTALSSTTVSGYVDVSLPNGKTSTLSPRDVASLRSAIQLKQLGFLRNFIGIKQKLSKMNADEFDAKYLQLILQFSKVPPSQARFILGGAAPTVY